MSFLDTRPEGRKDTIDMENTAADLFEHDATQSRTPCRVGCCAEEDGYKRLILAELNRRGLNVGWLEPKTKMSRSNLNRTIRGNYRLSDELRHKIFEALQIDPHQAYITVAMLGDIKEYHSPEAHLLAQNLRAVQKDVCNARKGRITDFFKPAIINQAAIIGVNSIFAHQEKIRACEQELFAK